MTCKKHASVYHSQDQREGRRSVNPWLLSSALLALPMTASAWVTVPKLPSPLLQGLNIPANAPTAGMWSAVQPWPMNGLHSVLLPNGRVLTYGTTTDGANQDGRTLDVWDPMLGFGADSHRTTNRAAQVNVFCGAATYLSDGRVMMSGGNSPLDSGLYAAPADVIDNSTQHMADQRWYATMLTLPDTRAVILGGMDPYSEDIENNPDAAIAAGRVSMTPEIYDPVNGWRSLFGANSRDAFGPDFLRASYPRAWVAPGGQVFGISTDKMWYLDANAGTLRTAGTFKGPYSATAPLNVGATNTAVMFAPGKVLVAGGNGSFNGDGKPASNMATVVDINGANPVLTEQPRMNFARRFPNSIAMPDGRVLITGGSTLGNNNGANAVFASEIWNPATGTWSVGAAAAIYRGYHSFSTLLTNGTVLSTGGGTPGPVTNLNAEIYYPPYLFRPAGAGAELAPRPVIDAISGLSFAYGSTLELDMVGTDPVTELVLIGNTAGTHSFNSGQRRIPLTFTQTGIRLTASLPNANIAPPGYYQVIALNASKVPSTGVIVGIGPMAVPNMPLDTVRNVPITINPVAAQDQAVAINASGLGVLQSAASTAASAMTFITRNGFANANCVSFEYAATPGRFLRHAGFRLQLGTNDGTALFRDDATFCPEVGLAGDGYTFRSRNFPANVIRHRNGEVWLDPADGSVALNTSASFFLKNAPTGNVPPTVALTAPAVNANIVQGTTVPMAANAGDSDGTVTKVDFYDGATLLGTATGTPYTFSWVTSATTATGTHNLTAKAYDNGGAVTTSTTVSVTVSSSTGSGTGTGLTGNYFSNPTLTGTPVLTRIEAPWFDWGTGAPAANVPADNFSVRWSGVLQSVEAGSYQFRTNSDDGVRVWINNVLVIDNWTAHAPTINTSGIVSLTAGQRVPITVEFQEFGGGAVLQFSWLRPGNVWAQVPVTQLYPLATNQAPTVSLTAPANNANVVQGTTITLSANATDSDGTVTKVEFYDGATLLGTATGAPYTFSWVTSATTATGTHTLTAKAYDNAGAVTSSSAVTITLSAANVPPANAVACASEGQVCTLPAGATASVWYGANTSWFVKTGVTGSIACNNATFGDPLFGTAKSCRYVVTSTGTTTAPTGALGEWTFDTASGTTAPDTSGNSKTLTLTAGTSITATGKSGPALLTNGANSIGGASTVGPVLNTAGSFSVSGWIRFDQLPVCWNQIMASQDGVTVSGFYLGIVPPCGTGTARATFSMLSADADASTVFGITDTTTTVTGTWYHLVGVRDATANTMSLYVNGNPVGTVANSTKWSANGPFAVGRSKFSGGARDPVYGAIDGVRAYGRALTQAEVTSLFQAGGK